jgi:hypothetical protein
VLARGGELWVGRHRGRLASLQNRAPEDKMVCGNISSMVRAEANRRADELRNISKSYREGLWLRRRRRPRRAAFFASVAIGLAIAASACGGGSPVAGVANVGTTNTVAPAAAAASGGPSSGGGLVEYARCMRSHGVSNFPDSASFGSSAAIKAAKGQISQISDSEASSPTFQAAQRACAKYAPSTTSPKHVSPKEMQKLLAVSRCMRAHGAPNFPDPNPTTGELSAPLASTRTPRKSSQPYERAVRSVRLQVSGLPPRNAHGDGILRGQSSLRITSISDVLSRCPDHRISLRYLLSQYPARLRRHIPRITTLNRRRTVSGSEPRLVLAGQWSPLPPLPFPFPGPGGAVGAVATVEVGTLVPSAVARLPIALVSEVMVALLVIWPFATSW